MGKTKHSKRKSRHKPTGMISVQEAEEKAKDTDAPLDEKTLPILEKLNSLEDREHACAGLANLVLESNAVPSLMKHNIVRRVAPLIMDKDERVQEASTGVLRNLTVCGGPKICRAMVDQDIMTPIIYYIKKFSESLSNLSECGEIIKQQLGVHEQIIHLLLNLCENSSETIRMANEECILPVLTLFLNQDVFPMQNVLVTAQCLCTMTEDNPTAGEALVSSKNSLAILEKTLLCNGESEQLLLLKVLAAGTLFNICQSLPSHNVFEMFQAIASVFGKVLDCDIPQYMEKLKTHQLPQSENDHVENGKLPEEKYSKVVNQEIEKLHHLLEAQKITLEILTNMCCDDESIDQDWDGQSTDDHSSDDFEDDCLEQEDMDLQVSSHPCEEIMTAVISHGLPKKVLQKCSFIKLDDSRILSTEAGASSRKIIETIQTRALVCLNNMVSAIDIDQLGGSEAIKHLWLKVIDIAFQNQGSSCGFTRNDDEFVEAASSALRSVLQKLFCTKNQCVTTKQASLLCYLSSVVKLEAARVNLMNVLGIVGRMLTASSEDVLEQLQHIGTVLRDVVVSGDSLWVIAEALDAIFDVFADSPIADMASSNIDLLIHLEKAVPVLRTRVKKERRRLGHRTPIVNTARTNLLRFLKYKKQPS